MDPGIMQSLVSAMMGPQQQQVQVQQNGQPQGNHLAPLVAALGNGQGSGAMPNTSQAGVGNPNRIQPLVAPMGNGQYMGVSPEAPQQQGPGPIQGLGQEQLNSSLDIPHHTTGIGQGINNLGAGVGHAIGTVARMLSGGSGGGMGGMMGKFGGMMGKFGGGG